MRTLLLSGFLASLTVPVAADPLDRQQVAAEAKWVLHLDAQRFVNTQIGKEFISRVLGPKSEKARTDLKRELNLDVDWSKVASVTAYGRGFDAPHDASGVLIIETSMALQPALDQAVERGIAGGTIQKVPETSVPTYNLANKGCVALAPGGQVIVGKTRDSVEAARSVLSGSAKSLEGTSALGAYPRDSMPFFFLAVAEGFAREAHLPANAAILRQADGAQFTAAEEGDHLALHLSVKAATSETALQIQQVAQGLISLGTLQAESNPELAAMARGAKVDANGPLVILQARIPVKHALEKMQAAH